MNPKIKRILAREGLIFLVTSFSAIAMKKLSDFYMGQFWSYRNPLDYMTSEQLNKVMATPEFHNQYQKVSIALNFWHLYWFIIYGYLLYLLIRFIIWAIRTLRSNQST